MSHKGSWIGDLSEVLPTNLCLRGTTEGSPFRLDVRSDQHTFLTHISLSGGTRMGAGHHKASKTTGRGIHLGVSQYTKDSRGRATFHHTGFIHYGQIGYVGMSRFDHSTRQNKKSRKDELLLRYSL